MLEIDRKTFKILDYDYSKDKNNVYYYDKVVIGADPKTFKHIEGTRDGKDAKYCFRDGRKVFWKELLYDE